MEILDIEEILETLFQFLYIAILIRVVLSWVPHNPYHNIIQWIYKITDPLLNPFKNIIPSYRIGIDLSPIFAFFALGIIKKLIFQILF